MPQTSTPPVDRAAFMYGPDGKPNFVPVRVREDACG